MNRSVRNWISREMRRGVASARQSIFELSSVLEAARCGEEEKIGNMPESLSGSGKVEGMEEAAAMLDEALELLESALESIDGAAETLGVEVDYKPSARATKEQLSTGRKGVRFQMMLPEAMMDELRAVSSSIGVSKNEMVCRALREYLPTIQ